MVMSEYINGVDPTNTKNTCFLLVSRDIYVVMSRLRAGSTRHEVFYKPQPVICGVMKPSGRATTWQGPKRRK